MGIAQTGTGKTAAFAIPVVQALIEGRNHAAPKQCQALILAPTRELAIQIAETVERLIKRTGLSHAVIFGGVSPRPQLQALARGVDIIIATPGRLLDHINTKAVMLSAVTHFVLDEADRMLDMGFIRDVTKIVALLPKKRQSLLFSATMPKSVEDLANGLLKDPVRVEVTPEEVTVDKIAQSVIHAAATAKRALMLDLMDDEAMKRVVVFTRTKHGANKLAAVLEDHAISCGIIHGNKTQAARQKALEGFRQGLVRVLVATDIAARGIDVAGITHVINFDVPTDPESYVHRIGRTARAGKEGVAITFCEPAERTALKAIERMIRRAIPVHALSGTTSTRVLAAPKARKGNHDEVGGDRGKRFGGGERREGGFRKDRPAFKGPRRPAGERMDFGSDSIDRAVHGEAKPAGFRKDGPRTDRPRSEGYRPELRGDAAPRKEGFCKDGPRQDGFRKDGPRQDGFRKEGGPSKGRRPNRRSSVA